MNREICVLATIALTLSTGCTVTVPTSASPSNSPDGAPASPPPTTDSPPAPSPFATTSATAAVTPQEPAPTIAPIAAREAAHEAARVRGEVFPITRGARATVVSIRMTVLTGKESRFLHSLSTAIIQHHQPQSMRMIEPAEGKVHLPSEVDGRPVCGPSLMNNVSAGDVIWASCVFGPLPETTKQVAVQFGPFGSFDAIPVR